MRTQIDIEALANEKGLRITDHRRVIAKVISDSNDHPNVDELYQRAIAIDRGISIATVLPDSAAVRGSGHPRPS